MDMKKYFKEIAILIAQLLMFYVFPLTAGPTDAMEWCFNYSCNLRTCDNYGQCIKKKAKYVYPLLVSVLLFLPFSSIIMILHSYTPFGIW